MTWNPFDKKPAEGIVCGRNKLCAVCGQLIVKGARMAPCRPLKDDDPRGLSTYPRHDGTTQLEPTYRHLGC